MEAHTHARTKAGRQAGTHTIKVTYMQAYASTCEHMQYKIWKQNKQETTKLHYIQTTKKQTNKHAKQKKKSNEFSWPGPVRHRTHKRTRGKPGTAEENKHSTFHEDEIQKEIKKSNARGNKQTQQHKQANNPEPKACT